MICGEEDTVEGAECDVIVSQPLVCPLLEQLNSNLAYWRAKPQVQGAAAACKQMEDAFSQAYPIVLDRAHARRVDCKIFR